ncbi:MAG: hypothetical protein Q7R96_02060 [Nanoarchaeota archaeon]|nr:hypothetical protein [Nanoarchaeota archaeon]
MKPFNNFATLLLARLGFIISSFFIFITVKQQILNYNQLLHQYDAMIGQISQAAVENTANIAQLSMIIETFGAITQRYLLFVFVGTPLLLFLAYLLFEGIYWKTLCNWKHWKTFYLRFGTISIIGWGVMLGILTYLWNTITLENYDFSLKLLLFPISLFLLQGCLTISYLHLDQGIIGSIKTIWKNVRQHPIIILLFSLGNFFILFISTICLFYVLLHYEQNITTTGTYLASIILIASIIGSIFYQQTIHYYFSIKK